MRRSILNGVIAVLSVCLCAIVGAHGAIAAEGIHVDGSAQMFAAFTDAGTRAFARETGVHAIAEQHTSGAGVKAIINGTCNVAAVARKLKIVEKAKDKTLFQTLVARDAIAAYVSSDNPVDQLSLTELQKVFAGEITDWSQLGGSPGAIHVVIPQTQTACNKNFRKAVMADRGFSRSTVIVPIASATLEKVQADPKTISFISYGAIANRPAFKALTVGGKSPSDPGYPIIQELYFVTKGQPEGDIQDYIDYFLSGAGQSIIRKNGMFPAR